MSYLFLQLSALFAIIVWVAAAFVRVVDPGDAIDHAYTLLPIMVDVGGGRMEAGEALLSSFGGGVVLMLADKNRATDGMVYHRRYRQRRLYNAHRVRP
jgi:hypothetical protein